MALIVTTFASAIAGEAAGWLVRFVHADFAWLKLIAFVTLQACLLGILGSIGIDWLFRIRKAAIKERGLTFKLAMSK